MLDDTEGKRVAKEEGRVKEGIKNKNKKPL